MKAKSQLENVRKMNLHQSLNFDTEADKNKVQADLILTFAADNFPLFKLSNRPLQKFSAKYFKVIF